MARAKKKKVWIWIVVAAAIALGAAAGAFVYLPKLNAESVYVYSLAEGLSGMSDYYEGSGESSGQITTDKVQPVYISATQTITEIMVEEGQQVKKGDVLLTYDTTLSDIELQRKWLSVEQDKVDLQTAKRELAVINSYVPIYYKPEPTPDPNAEPEKEISDLELEGKDYVVYKGKGDTSLTPLYCWLRSKAMVDELMIEALFYGRGVDSLYVVFQHTEEDSNEGAVTQEFGLKFVKVTSAAVEDENGQLVSPAGTVYRFTYFTPTHGGGGESNIVWNSGYTATEIHSMRVAKQEEIKELEFSIKMGEAEYKIMEKEADDGKVEAQFDGTVVGILDQETAQMEGLPIMKLSGGGGYYVMGSVSELDLSSISVGQKVDVMSWDTGMSYEGTIVEIQPFPQENGNYYYGGSQNVSYYPYKVFIDESAMLQDGYYVSTTLRQEEGEGQRGSLYVNNAFVISEGASTYVYVRGEDGLLVKRRVRLGGMLWGEYSKVVEGITAEDYLAFPYGKEVKEGAPTQEGTWETLYGY
ncbi:MAG: HlyD family efflux transporter periplasmic adaptor subunit [Ruminococcaceae bacterium]|nr:HlyD family efflux transporter periplasmic adaptor subunit [Oscillospiraceae bacterium]